MPLPKWGGVSLFVCSPHGKGSPISSNCSESLSCSNRARFSAKQVKTGQKLDFICLAWCFLGKIGDHKGQKPNIFLKSREGNGVLRWSAACLHRVHWCRLSRVQDLRSACVGPPVVCSVALSSFLLCAWRVALEICLYSRFNGVFSAVCVFGVGLYCLGALRGLWGFVRVNS